MDYGHVLAEYIDNNVADMAGRSRPSTNGPQAPTNGYHTIPNGPPRMNHGPPVVPNGPPPGPPTFYDQYVAVQTELSRMNDENEMQWSATRSEIIRRYDENERFYNTVMHGGLFVPNGPNLPGPTPNWQPGNANVAPTATNTQVQQVPYSQGPFAPGVSAYTALPGSQSGTPVNARSTVPNTGRPNTLVGASNYTGALRIPPSNDRSQLHLHQGSYGTVRNNSAGTGRTSGAVSTRNNPGNNSAGAVQTSRGASTRNHPDYSSLSNVQTTRVAPARNDFADTAQSSRTALVRNISAATLRTLRTAPEHDDSDDEIDSDSADSIQPLRVAPARNDSTRTVQTARVAPARINSADTVQASNSALARNNPTGTVQTSRAAPAVDNSVSTIQTSRTASVHSNAISTVQAPRTASVMIDSPDTIRTLSAAPGRNNSVQASSVAPERSNSVQASSITPARIDSVSTMQTQNIAPVSNTSATNEVDTTVVANAFDQLRRINTSTPSASEGSQSKNQSPVAKDSKAASKPTEKSKSWNQEQMEAANLPTSKISATAMQAGAEYGRTGVTSKKAATQSNETVTPRSSLRNKNPPSKASTDNSKVDAGPTGLSVRVLVP